MRRKNRYKRNLYNAYDLELKKTVIVFAEQNGNKEAQARYGISEANIRRWRRLKTDIFSRSQGLQRRRRRQNIKVNCDHLEQESQSSIDSMPLQERLSKVAAQEKIAQGSSSNQQVLKSQPLSPTKLKVTRQNPKLINKPPVEPPQSPVNEEMCLRWNSHHSNMQTAFPNILSKEQYVDVTLAAEGKTLKCHRLILSSCSPYFEEILSGISPFQHPVLFMRDIPFWILKSLCDFMYAGEVHIFQNKLEELLTVAEALKIKGLAGKSTPPENNNQEEANKSDNHNRESRRKQPQAPPPPPLKRNPHINPRPQNFESTSHDYEDDLLDPLDLLEPLYEEAAEEKKPSTVVKPKENKYQYQPVKKPFTRRLRKRKYSEQREPSPPPVFSFRKGTRSRPNVKIPKYYHSDFSNPSNKQSQNNTHQSDPLLDVDEIKTEPIDVEDNLIDYSDEDHHQYSIENSVDSPIIITSTPLPQDKFKKIKLTKPVITEVHTIEETNTTPGGLEVIKITMQQPEKEDPLQVEQEPPPLGEAQEIENGSENPTVEELEPPVLEKEVREVETEEEESIIEQETVIQIQDVRSTAEEIEEGGAQNQEESGADQNPEEEGGADQNPEEEGGAEQNPEEEENGATPNPEDEENGATQNQEEEEMGATQNQEEQEKGVTQNPEEEKGATQNQEEEEETDVAQTQDEEVRMEIADVRTTSLEETGDQNENQAEEEEERRTTSLNHLEKEAMNVANAISMENQNENPDLDL